MSAPAGGGPLRVTHVVFDFNGGGMESLVAEMASRFRGTPVAVSLITLSGRTGRLGELTRGRFEQFHVVRPRRGVSMLLPIGLAATIRQTRADVIHLHTGSWYKGALAARLAGVPWVIYTEHGREHDDPPVKRWLDRIAAHWTGAVVGVSARLARYLAATVGIRPDTICVIHNAVDTTVFTPGAAPAALRERLGIPAGTLVIGSVGRLEPVKAYERLIEAAALLRRQLTRPFVVVIFGAGSARGMLQATVERLGVQDLVRLPGWSDTAVEAYRLLDIFVLSSRSEGQSVSLMEAMACGVPPVVTSVGANAELVGPELAAQVVPAEDPAALARAIAATAAADAQRQQLAGIVRRRAEALYSLDRMVNEYERLYRGRGRIPPELIRA